jgi:hypothetical protein
MKIQLLVIGRHEEILQTLVRLINKNEAWEAKGCLQDEEAIQLFDTVHFDMILLSSGIAKHCEDSLCLHFRNKRPAIKIVQHYGGGSGLLSNEILQALNKP